MRQKEESNENEVNILSGIIKFLLIYTVSMDGERGARVLFYIRTTYLSVALHPPKETRHLNLLLFSLSPFTLLMSLFFCQSLLLYLYTFFIEM